MLDLGTFWTGFFVSAIVAPFALSVLRRIGSKQTIYEHAPSSHQVKQGTPTMGGLVILAGALFSTCLGLAAWALDKLVPVTRQSAIWSVVVLFIGFGLIGFLDDFVIPRKLKGKRGLGWKEKIVLQGLVATASTFLMASYLPGVGAKFLLVFLILFFANAFNFADGLDALAGSLLLGFLFGVSIIAYRLQLQPIIVMATGIAGATIPFLFLNAPPAKVFMGDVGSLPIGAILGWMLYFMAAPGLAQQVNERPVALVVLSLILILELVLVPIQVGFYKLTKKRLFPMTPIHHAFEKKGWPETRVVWAFALVQLLLSLIAIEIAAGRIL